ncbi:MAG: amino acid ABC transporter substrate-binding protein [Lachnospiraceae bacterium]|nr:amino acid ABC transporter substrate-binding protein [Lachnospiraceae bacterium]
MKLKKKILCSLLAIGTIASLLSGCGKKDDKTFTVGFDAEYPPYGYMDDNGEYTGFDLELAEEVCKINGWTLKKQPIDWANKDNELNSGSIDCIWNGFTINGREDKYEWSVPYVDNSQVIVVKADSGINSLSDLAGKTVGVQAASAALDVLTDEEGQKELGDSFKKLQEFADYNTAFVELQAGSIDAIAMDIGVAQYQISGRGDEFIILDEHLNAEQYGVGFKLGNTKQRDEVNKALKELKQNGKFDELAEKYGLSEMTCLEP